LVAIKKITINDTNVNLESIDVPYVSDIGRATGYKYLNWGGSNKDPWKTWQIHTQVYERTPDFWWIKSLYYWDVPVSPFMILLALNVFSLYYFTRKLKNISINN
jgi:hypothetical protein